MGDIAYLCSIAAPTHGLITNIAPAHLEGFGSVERIAEEKGQLFLALEAGTAFVNLTDNRIAALKTVGETITFGLTADCDFPADFHEEPDGTISLTIDSLDVFTHSFNLSHAKNILSVAPIAATLGIDWATFQERITSYHPPAGRCRVIQFHELTIIDDTYNANPESTAAGIDFLTAFSGNGRRILIFGDMFELGADSADLHRRVGAKCSDAHLDAVFTVGNDAAHTDQALVDIPLHKHFESKDRLLAEVNSLLHKGDRILVKGSRGMEMETIIAGLTEAEC